MRQQEAVQEGFSARCSGLCNGGREGPLGVLHAMPDHAKPRKDAIVLANVRRELQVDGFALLKLEMLLLKLLTDCESAIIKLQDNGSGQYAARGRRPELMQIAD